MAAPGSGQAFDRIVLGHRLRHLRRGAGLTLSELGVRIGRPASYLSQVENVRSEPNSRVLGSLPYALDCSTIDFLDPTPLSRRPPLEYGLQLVSYTYLTPPTIRSVYIEVVAVSVTKKTK